MGLVLVGDLINSYPEETAKGKAYMVHQISYRAGKAVVTVSVKDFTGIARQTGPVKLPVFPDVWVGKQGGPRITWIVSKDEVPDEKAGAGRLGLAK